MFREPARRLRAEPAEIDDPPDALLAALVCEEAGGLAVEFGVLGGVSERVDEVEDRVDVFERRVDLSGVERVAGDDFDVFGDVAG